MPKPMCKTVDKAPARRCQSCQMWRTIDNVRRHEKDCPQAWRDEQRTCSWCGQTFTPTWKGQAMCGDECAAEFWNL